VNVGTTGRIDDVFTVTYTADEYARVWIEYDSENVTFVADGDSIEGEANNVTLAPNETVAVGLAFDTRGKAAGTRLGADEFSIEAEIAEPEEATAEGVNFDAVTQIESHENPGDNYGFKIVNQGTWSVMFKMSYYSVDPSWLDGGGYDRTDPPV
jgi:hypothetical protein